MINYHIVELAGILYSGDGDGDCDARYLLSVMSDCVRLCQTVCLSDTTLAILMDWQISQQASGAP